MYAHLSSSVVEALSYNTDQELLDITFCSGQQYRYEHVPAYVVEQMVSAPSVGRYFIRHIRDTYRYRVLSL